MGISQTIPETVDTREYPWYGRLHFYVDDDTGYLHVEDDFEFWRKPEKREVVSEGFRSDLASIPILARAIFRPQGRYTKASVVHDWDYATGNVSKLAADLTFYRGMKVLKVPWWKAIPFTGTVMTLGWWAWFKHRLRNRRNS